MNSSIRCWTILMAAIVLTLEMAGCAPSLEITKPVASLEITKPVANSTVSSPVEICFEVQGFQVQPAKKGVQPGTGHHHIMVDIPQPKDLTASISKGEGKIHMGDGSHCKKVKLDPGLHTLQGIFADGNHVPVNPLLTTAITLVVEK